MAQVLNGKGFEYACLQSMQHQLSETQQIEILTTPTYLNAQLSFHCLDPILQQKFNFAADAAIRVLRRLEPQLENHQNNQPLILTIQQDARGQQGDVRDVLTVRNQNQWEIGLSAKYNHSAVKHSRLSQRIDFGREWLNYPVSENYFREIRPIFDELEELRHRNYLWKDLDHKADRFYVPVLNAFIRELQRLSQMYTDIPSRLLSYLLGRHDFYKVIAQGRNRVTEIQGFSMYGTLNRQSGNVAPQIRLPRLRLPSRFYDIDFKPNSKTTIFIVCDEGWNLSARIHNASRAVEPSLKFDIQLNGVPPTLYRHYEPWD
ncbi:HaeIII family restriction endonuclease [Paenibacillus odorifer]|uniref:HaeIII family restriction endonuclease n=1 Tax=Paenibacillus odorifer TaxID=189426 RepID=UPI00096F3939|nr:HaeIII family restriction endonuclease [Paenibacillus odorifer]